MSDIFSKCREWPGARQARAVRDTGTYPYYRVVSENSGGGEVVVEGRRMVMAASNDYLGLAADPRVRQAATEATARLGTSCSSSRLLNGTLALHERLEAELAAFLGRDAALVTTTGFQANLVLSCLLGRDDVVLLDQHCHASLIDAARLGDARFTRFRHNDLDHLARLLERGDPGTGRLIVTEGLFSMTGDLAALPELAELAARSGARLVVDGAHDTGLLGANGRGAAEHLAAEAGVDLVTGTLSKCFGSLGGFLAGSEDVVDFMRHHGRALIYSAAAPPGALAAALAALDIVRREPEHRERARALAARLHGGLRSLGYDTGAGDWSVVPVFVGQDAACLRLWNALFDAGVFAHAILPPAVPPGRALVRLSLTAANTDEHVERILDVFAACARCAPEMPTVSGAPGVPADTADLPMSDAASSTA
ncbi:aminotransferase class I/II-fold pyridoxal phosphate-dependent enzyme [Streptomyces sp. 4N509B]|uniref:aminotransferase class I/II-fold pyridoxal phosphate-dependent enzyme n=1 Tax=Streptomyces sp. 4N509B TaxID=3457413 RepID=UPI003FD16456